MEKENETLLIDNDRMKTVLDLNSINSSLPSSTDQKTNVKQTISNNRKKTNRSVGGQKRHKGFALTK